MSLETSRTLYLNGGGGAEGRSTPRPYMSLPQVESALVDWQHANGFTLLNQPMRFIFGLPAARPPCRPLTDAAILLMDPVDVLELYYNLQVWDARRGTCGVLKDHPVYCQNNPLRAADRPSSLASEDIRAMYEDGLRQRIYELRADLRYVDTPEGRIPGLIDLSQVRLRPDCRLSTTAEIFKYVMAAVGGIVSPTNWVVIITQLALSTASTLTKIGAQIRKAKAQAALINSALGGAYGIIEERNRDLLIAAGLLQDTLDYEEAIAEPTTPEAWALAWAIGLPHPAMVCPRPRAPGATPAPAPEVKSFPIGCGPGQTCTFSTCSPIYQLGALRDWVNRLYFLFYAKLQLAMETAVLNYPDYLEVQTSSWPAVPSQIVNLELNQYRGLEPIIGEKDGRYYVRTQALESAPSRWIEIDSDPRLAPVRDWLNVRLNPEVIDQAKADAVRAAMLTQPAAAASIMVYPPKGTTHESELPFLTGPVTRPVPAAETSGAGLSLVTTHLTPPTGQPTAPAAGAATLAPGGATVGAGTDTVAAGKSNAALWLLVGAALLLWIMGRKAAPKSKL